MSVDNGDINNPIVPTDWRASTNLNPSIRTYGDLAHRVKIRLGYPDVDIAISDEAIATHINEAIEVFSRYAGYDQEYVIFSDEMLNDSCEVKLDDLVDSCYTCMYNYNDPNICSADGNIVWEDVLTSTDVTERLLGSGMAYINNTSDLITHEPDTLNGTSTTEKFQELLLKYHPQHPWDFDTKEADLVDVYPLSSYPATEYISPELPAWIKIEGDIGEIYPPNWDDKDPCMSDSEWWGLSATIQGWTPENATHVIISGVPYGTVGGLQPLKLNTGKGATFFVCSGIDTEGAYMNATVQFVNNYELPPELSGEFSIKSNNGFVMELDSEWCDAPNTPNDIPVHVEFSEYLSSFGYNSVSSFESTRGFYDESLKAPRKVVNVFSSDPAGGDAGQTLFNFEYAFAQGLLGYDGMGNRFHHQGYDLVSYDIGRQYIETIQRMLGKSTIGHQFNKRTQKLRIYTNYAGATRGRSVYLLGVWIERRIEEMIQEHWVLDYTTALCQITMGNILTRFSGATALGGISINGTDILSQGKESKESLLTWIREQNSEGGLSVPFYME